MRLSQYIGDFQPDAHVYGFAGCNFIALICNKNSATFSALSLFKIMLQMYKVFIQDRPIFFISAEEISNFKGIFIPESLGETHGQYFIDLVPQLPEDISIYVTCQSPETAIDLFFENYDMVEAAGGIVKRKEKYLFIKRNGIWDLPKGKMDDEETPELTARREIQEECGIRKPVVNDLILITYHTYSYHGTPTIKKTYWFEMSYNGTKEVKPQLEEGITKVSWKSKEKAEKIMEKTYASIKDVLNAYFSK